MDKVNEAPPPVQPPPGPPPPPPPPPPVFGCPPGLEPLTYGSQFTIICRQGAGYNGSPLYDVITEAGLRVYTTMTGDTREERPFSTKGVGYECLILVRYDGLPVLDMLTGSSGCCAGDIVVAFAGKPIGIAHQSSGKCNCCGDLRFGVTDETNQPILNLVLDNSPCGINSSMTVANVTVMSSDGLTQLGSIMTKAHFQDSNYVVTCQPSMKPTTKAVLVGMAIMLHCQTINVRRSQRGRRGMLSYGAGTGGGFNAPGLGLF